MSNPPQIAIFDLDLTLTCRHLWKDLGYHRMSAEELKHQAVSRWVADQGGPSVFLPESLRKLFLDLRQSGFDLGIATYNYEHVARLFLETFDLLDYFRSEWIIARDTQGSGSKTDDWALIFQKYESGAGKPTKCLYYDDSQSECVEVKEKYSWIKVHHVLIPLCAPAPELRIVE